MTGVKQITEYLDALLATKSTPDYPTALNGLQLENRSEIRGIASAVDFSSRVIKGAIARDANLLLVHHGMFWGGIGQIQGPAYARLRELLDKDIAVYSSHLPLDRHPDVGNNVLLARTLGLEPSEGFAKFQSVDIGVSGTCDVDTFTLVTRAEKFASENGGTARHSAFDSPRKTRRWAICTGAGASSDTLREAEELGIDTLIVGEGPHWTAVHAEEQGLVIIYAGHYATETLGVHALGELVSKKYGLPHSFINAPTGS
jgi:dinuclear metal center YbgI/SA1388 family protein